MESLMPNTEAGEVRTVGYLSTPEADEVMAQVDNAPIETAFTPKPQQLTPAQIERIQAQMRFNNVVAAFGSTNYRRIVTRLQRPNKPETPDSRPAQRRRERMVREAGQRAKRMAVQQ